MADKPKAPEAPMSQHKALAMDKPVDTGAGKGPMGGKNPPPSRW